MGKRVKLGNFWCTITSYEEIWQEMDERERFFKESIERHKLMKEKEKYFGLRPETDEQAESGNFSEEQVNTEELEHWKESEAEKIESLEEADKRRSKKRGNK